MNHWELALVIVVSLATIGGGLLKFCLWRTGLKKNGLVR